jgi:hypothetical protein
MNLSCLLSLGDGIIFHRFRKNPFHPAKTGRSHFLDTVKPVSTQPIQPALDALHQAGESDTAGRAPTPLRAGDGSVPRPLTGIDSAPTILDHDRAATCQPRSLSRTEKVEVLVLKCLAIALALACIGCGFGIQHITHIRQKNEICRQLRQKEVELRGITQAYRSLESCVIAKAAEDFRRIETCPVVAKRAPQKVPTRG